MKFKIFLLTYLGISVLIFNLSCKKFDSAQTPKEIQANSYDVNFFNSHRTNDIKENAIVNYLKRINEKENFVDKVVKQIGYPRWDKAIYTRESNNNSFAASNDSSNIFFIPFVRDSQNYVNASLIIETNSSDTSFQFKCDWQYTQMQNTPNSVQDSAENFAVLIMKLDQAVFGYTKFSILDNNLFKRNNKNAISIELAAPNQNSGNNLMLAEGCSEVTISWNDCPYPSCNGAGGSCDGCSLCTSSISYTFCTGGGGGGSTGGSGIPPGGSPPGGGTTNGGGTPTGGGGGGWIPILNSNDPVSPINDSIPNILARACNTQSDSVFNWGLSNNFKEQSFILVRKNGIIYPKNYKVGTEDGSGTKVNYFLGPGEVLVGYVHTHPVEIDPKGRSFFSFNDIQEARKNAAFPSYCAIIECGNKRYALVIEDKTKLNAFINLNRLQELKNFKLEEITVGLPNYNSNRQQASVNAVIGYFGSAAICGIGFYEATSPNKTNFTKLNP
jgi:uncharacterized membrane protein YgcG